MNLVPRNHFRLARQPPRMPSPLPVAAALPASLHGDVDPVLVGMIVILLLVVFAFFLMIRRTLLSFTEGLRQGRQ